ncbi:MAG TPA: DUF998 domain-containing protein [Candidatus Saccharimonadales bacterium]|nr:DUF998 domain-containing protein [Candidatus Saccharimonadales bacterium]
MKTSNLSMVAAKAVIGISIAYLILLALLHIIKPEVDPSWVTLSIYSRGNFGWIGQLNFILLGLSHLALFIMLKSQIKNIYGRVGLVLLCIAGIGAIIGGIGISDPMNTPQDQLTTSALWHSIGAALAVWGAPLAAILLNLALLRKNADWKQAKAALLATIALPFIGLVLFMSTAGQNGGHYGPGATIGWMNRVVVIAIIAWQITLALSALNLRKK